MFIKDQSINQYCVKSSAIKSTFEYIALSKKKKKVNIYLCVCFTWPQYIKNVVYRMFHWLALSKLHVDCSLVHGCRLVKIRQQNMWKKQNNWLDSRGLSYKASQLWRKRRSERSPCNKSREDLMKNWALSKVIGWRVTRAHSAVSLSHTLVRHVTSLIAGARQP